MAAPTQGQKLDDLSRLANNLVTRLDSIHAELRREIDRHESDLKHQTERHELTAKSLEEARVVVAILRRDVDDLRQSKDEWGRRVWTLVTSLLGVAVGAILASVLRR